MADTTLNLTNLLQQNIQNNTVFCAYKKPKENKINLITQKNTAIYKVADFTESGFVFVPFIDISEGIIFPLHLSDNKEFSIPKSKLKSTKNKSFSLKENQKETHEKLVQKTVNFLKNGQAEKIVISRKKCIKKTDFNSVATFIHLAHNYDNAMVYLWHHPKIGLWIGSTPETFLQIKNNHFTTMALAGTQKKKKNVVWQKKEIQEQQYVTNFITATLHKNNIAYKTTSPYTVKAGNIAHIKTDITGVLQPNFNLKKLITDLHPTPAVCGIPKSVSKHFIVENENYNREFYTGFLGELNFTSFKNRNKRNIENQSYHNTIKETNLFVNLRCMQVIKNTICLYIGGGITKDSVPENEFLETVEKSKILLNFII